MLTPDPERRLSQLCRRHGLPDAAGERYLPLLRRAADRRPDLWARVGDYVDRQLGRLARERARTRRLQALRDEACLKAIAPLLHTWRPERGA